MLKWLTLHKTIENREVSRTVFRVKIDIHVAHILMNWIFFLNLSLDVNTYFLSSFKIGLTVLHTLYHLHL